MPRTGPVPSAYSGERQAPGAPGEGDRTGEYVRQQGPRPCAAHHRDRDRNRITARTSRNDPNRVNTVPAKAADPLSLRPAAPSVYLPAAAPGSPGSAGSAPGVPPARPHAAAVAPSASAPLPGRRAGTAALAPWPPRLRRRTPVPARHRRGHGPPGAGPFCRRSFPYLCWWCGQAPVLGLSGPSAGLRTGPSGPSGGSVEAGPGDRRIGGPWETVARGGRHQGEPRVDGGGRPGMFEHLATMTESARR